MRMFGCNKRAAGLQRVATFYKVSSNFFLEDLSKCSPRPEFELEDLEKIYEGIKLPTRATAGSAGYDFYTPFDIELQPGESITFPTGVRVLIDSGWWLMMLPKSGLGCSYRTVLWNTAGVIDSDYFHTKNEGDIILKLSVDGELPLSLKKGDKVVQGIFLPYGLTYDDDVCTKRGGGFGSTGK